MLVPKIVHRNLDPSAVLDSVIQYRVDGLLRLEPRLQTCLIVLEAAHGHRLDSRSFTVQIELGLPGRQIAAATGHDHAHGHADIYAAVDEAFDNARRQLLGVKASQRDAHRSPADSGMLVH